MQSTQNNSKCADSEANVPPQSDIDTKMAVVEMPIGDIKPYEKNPRKNDHAVDAVAASIKEFGWRVPIVVDENLTILCGHARHKAALKLGLKFVPIHVAVGLTDEQRKAYRLADNKTAELAEWDFGALELELNGITEIDMSAFGFDLGGEKAEAEEDNFEVELPNEPKSKLGDIWLLGRHRLSCGDSTIITDVERLMDGSQADMCLTDPPYGVAYVGGTDDALTIENDAVSKAELKRILTDSFSNANIALRDGGVFYIWHSEVGGVIFRSACEEIGWQIRQCLIWVKNSMVMGRQDYQWKHEPCLYGWKKGGHTWTSDRKQTTILEFDRPTVSKEHPTMKPVKLFDYLICNNTQKGDIVFDPFAGSGTTIIACEQNGRTARCIEIDPKYCDVIVKRWEELTGLTAVLDDRRAGVTDSECR